MSNTPRPIPHSEDEALELANLLVDFVRSAIDKVFGGTLRHVFLFPNLLFFGWDGQTLRDRFVAIYKYAWSGGDVRVLDWANEIRHFAEIASSILRRSFDERVATVLDAGMARSSIETGHPVVVSDFAALARVTPRQIRRERQLGRLDPAEPTDEGEDTITAESAAAWLGERGISVEIRRVRKAPTKKKKKS